jgi:hypothetical protein
VFGSVYFGAAYFGEEFSGTFGEFLSDTRFSVTTISSLQATALFASTTQISIAATVNLSTISRLESDSYFSVSIQDANLAVLSRFSATTSFGISGDGTFLSVAQHDLQGFAEFDFSTLASLPGATTVTSTSEINVSTTVFLQIPAPISTSPNFHIGVFGNITLTGPSAIDVIFTINGVNRTSDIRFETVRVTDILNEAPNTLTCRLNGTPPSVGSEVKLGLGDLTSLNLIFGGTIQIINQAYDGLLRNPMWDISCMDYTFLLNRRKVWEMYKDLSATSIVLSLMAEYTSGFTVFNVQPNLPVISVTFNGEDISNALNEVASLVGGYWYVDYTRNLHFFVTENLNPPDTIDASNLRTQIDPPLTMVTDISQIRTRVFVQGASEQVVAPNGFAISAGSSVIPMDDVEIFSAGQVISNKCDIINYTGKFPGGSATVITGSVTEPPFAPSVQLIPGTAGRLIGTYGYKVSFGNSTGETLPGPAAVIVAPAVNTPESAPGLGPSSSVGPLVGSYQYVVTNVTSLGETLQGPSSFRLASGIAAPGPFTVQNDGQAGLLQVNNQYNYVATFVSPFGETNGVAPVGYVPGPIVVPGINSIQQFAFGGLRPGFYNYATGIVTQFGETTAQFITSVTTGLTPSPLNPNYSGIFDTSGRIAPGTYRYACSQYNENYGETDLSSFVQVSVGGSLTVRLLMNLPVVSGGATGLRLYRSNNGSVYKLVIDLKQSGGQVYDSLAESELGGQYPIQQIRPGVFTFLNIQSSGDVGVVGRKVYRTKVGGGSDFYVVGEIPNNNNGVTIIDSTNDLDLDKRAPIVQTTGRRAFLNNIPTGPNGIIGRRIYRTKANGSQYFFLGELKDNVSRTLSDNTPDTNLSTTLPGLNTAGGEAIQLTSIPSGPPAVLARKIYRTLAGGTEFKFLTQINGNNIASFLDNIPDTSLGGNAPIVATGGGSAVQVFNLPIGPAGVTSRIIYRTPGNDFFAYKYLATINDNNTLSYIDTAPDSDLGRLPPIEGSLGALPGDITLQVKSTSGFTAPGWIEVGNQLIFYTNITATSFTGIPRLQLVTGLSQTLGVATMTTQNPHQMSKDQSISIFGASVPEWNGSHKITAVLNATQVQFTINAGTSNTIFGIITTSAPGAIIGSIAGGTQVLAVPMLIGTSGIDIALVEGDDLALWVQRDDLTAQANLAALEGGDGIHEFFVNDTSLRSVADCNKRGDAELFLFKNPIVTVNYATTDIKTRSGKDAVITFGAPTNITKTLKILEVNIDRIGLPRPAFPRYTVKASSVKFSLSDLIRHVVLDGSLGGGHTQ